MAPRAPAQPQTRMSSLTPLPPWERDLVYLDARCWLKENTQQGVRLRMKGVDATVQFEEASFYCESELREYFNVEQIDHLLKIVYRIEEGRPDARTIRTQFLKVFCILLLISQVDVIHILIHYGHNDENLPVSCTTDPQPDCFDLISDPTKRQHLWEAFCEESWKFCPHVFHADAHQVGVDAHRILPILHLTQLDKGNSATTWRVDIHPHYHHLEKSTNPYAETYVLKISNRLEPDAIEAYNSETSAFRKFKEPYTDIVKYLGSFHQKDASCILLEYADQGNLQHYFRKTQPRNKEDIIAFWKHFLRILWGLQWIHHLFQGSHHDLKPENILVFSNGESSPYRYIFKIADLGLCRYSSTQTSQMQALRLSTAGSRTFGCPESRRLAAFSTYAMDAYQKSDVWSIVCIISVACTWVVDGPNGVNEYSEFRRLGRQKSAIAEEDVDSFHDDRDVLKQVCDWHTELHTRSMKVDLITEQMWKLIQPGFNPVDERTNVEVLRIAIQSQLDKTSTNDCGTSSRYTPSHTAQQPSNGSSKLLMEPVTPVRGGNLTITGNAPSLSPDRMSFGHNNRNSLSMITRGLNNDEHLRQAPTDPFSAQPSQHQARPANDALEHGFSQPPSNDCPKHGHKKTESMTVAELIVGATDYARLPYAGLLPPLRTRDHVIVIDNCETMRRHWDELMNLVRGLASLLAPMDDDGLELYWTSFGHDKFRKAHNLVDKVRSLKYRCETTTDPTPTIMAIYEKHKKKLLKGKGTIFGRKYKNGKQLSIYFLTDGEWRRDSNPKLAIERLVKYLDANDKDESTIGIQFIQFGNSQVGSARLQELDDFKPNGLDIVDTTRSDGNVWKMLLGGIDPSFDNDNCICERDK